MPVTVFTHGNTGITRPPGGPWYLFTGQTRPNGDALYRRLTPGRTRAIRTLQHAATQPATIPADPEMEAA